MAISTTSQILYDGPLRTKMQFTGTSDGSGELTSATLVDASALSPSASGLPCKAVKVQRITGNTSYGTVQLLWGALEPVLFAQLAGSDIDMDYRNITGITNLPAGPSATGDILISTDGFAAGSTFMLEIEMQKKFS